MAGWKVKLWRFKTVAEIDAKRQKMNEWVEKHRADYDIRPVYVNNAWGVEYRPLLKL